MNLRIIRFTALAAVLLAGAPGAYAATSAGDSDQTSLVVAQASDTRSRELEPRYQPVPPQEKSSFNADYIFVLSRSLAESTLHPAVKAPLFIITVPLDLAMLPFAAIAGLFG